MRTKPKDVLFVATVCSHVALFHLPYIAMLRSWGCRVHVAAALDRLDSEVAEVADYLWNIPFARTPYDPRNFLALWSLVQLMRRIQPVSVHVHTPIGAFLGRLAAKLTRTSSVLYTAHGFHFYRGAPLCNWVLYYPLEWVGARWTDIIIVLNSEDAIWAEKLGFAPENLFLVHGVGVDLEQYSAQRHTKSNLRSELGLEEDALLITCVAELNRNKNHAFLLLAWRELALAYPNAHLLIVGDGQLRQSLSALVRKASIPQVHFLGFRDDVAMIMRESDIITLVSKREGLPRAIMEAMVAERPVVATNIRGNRDLVQDGVTGFLVELGDRAGLKISLGKLLDSRGLRQDMGRRGRKRIKSYAIDNVLAEMADIYSRLLDRSSLI